MTSILSGHQCANWPWDITRWRHQMETFSVLLTLLCGEFTGHRWIHRTKASDAELWCFFFICAWINGWVNNREVGDLRRLSDHYDVTVARVHCMVSTWYTMAFVFPEHVLAGGVVFTGTRGTLININGAVTSCEASVLWRMNGKMKG